jgi:4-hydroxybenzoate polyprenyltransferase
VGGVMPKLIRLLTVALPESNMKTDGFIKRIFLYSKERFNLWQFIPLSLILSGVLALGTQVYLSQTLLVGPVLLSAGALFLFFFRLRIFDEFKDYDHDLKYYSSRPVPRGLISKKELSYLLIPLIILEVLIAWFSGTDSIILFIFSFVYSLLMFKEFFVKNWLKTNFTLYIFSHEILLFPLFFYLCAINGFNLISLENTFYWYLILYVGLFMFLLEITRKVRPKDQEIASRDTYTAQYGIGRISVFLITISILAIIGLWKLFSILNINYLLPIIISSFFMLVFFWRLYEFNREPVLEISKKVFLSSIYFVFVSCIVAVIYFLK